MQTPGENNFTPELLPLALPLRLELPLAVLGVSRSLSFLCLPPVTSPNRDEPWPLPPLAFPGLESVTAVFCPLSEARSLMVDTSPDEAIVEMEADDAMLSARLDCEMFSRTL